MSQTYPENGRLVPRSVPSDGENMKPTLTSDAETVGDQATLAVASCLDAADDIEKMMAHVQSVADEIKKTGASLAGDFRSRAGALSAIVENFAKLSAASAGRMAEERKHLEDIAKGNS